jgi:hypothetical protein
MVYKKKISIMNTLKMKQYFLLVLMAMASVVAFAQDDDSDDDDDNDDDGIESPCENKFGTDSVETQKSLSMFNQYYQEKEYLKAYDYWKYLFENAPCVQKRVTYAGPYIVKQKIREVVKERKPVAKEELVKLKELKAAYVDGAKAANAAAGKPNYDELKAAYEEAKKTYDDYKEEMLASREAHKKELDDLADIIYACHRKRIELHGQEGYVLGKLADDMSKLTPDRRGEALGIFWKSIQLQGNKTKYDVPKDFVYAAVKEYKDEKLSMDSLFLILDAVSPIIDANLAANPVPTLEDVQVGTSLKTVKKYFFRPDSTAKVTIDGKSLDQYIYKDGIVYFENGKVYATQAGFDADIIKDTIPSEHSEKDLIEGGKWKYTQDAVIVFMKPYLACDKIIELKQPGFEVNKGNAGWLKSTIDLLDRGNCDGEEFYTQCSEALYSLAPSADAAVALARSFTRKGENDKAVSYYLNAAELAETDKEKEEIYIKLAKLSLVNKSYAKVREYARKAIAVNANNGEAYILIGDAYAASAPSCGSGDLGRAGVYLVAVDKYAKAKSVDASVAAKATEKINKYSAYFPDKETAFFKGINNGDSYRVGCWIGESTVVRTTGG